MNNNIRSRIRSAWPSSARARPLHGVRRFCTSQETSAVTLLRTTPRPISSSFAVRVGPERGASVAWRTVTDASFTSSGAPPIPSGTTSALPPIWCRASIGTMAGHAATRFRTGLGKSSSAGTFRMSRPQFVSSDI